MKRLLLVMVLLFLAGTAIAGVRCGNDIAKEGDSKIDVISACGAPDMQYNDGYIARRTRKTKREIPVDVWVYNNLAHYEIHILTFHGDVLKKIEWKRK